MKNVFIVAALLVALFFPKNYLLAQDSQLKIEQLMQLILQLQQQLAQLQKQQPQTTAATPKRDEVLAYGVNEVGKITYQEVYDDGRNPLYRYEVALVSGQKVVVVVPKKGSVAEIAKKFKASGFTGDEVKQLTGKAKRLPGLRWQTCELKSNKSTYEVNEPITLTWSSDAKYVAFNAYGSSNKKAYVDESFRESSGSVTIKVSEPGRHYVNMNVYPWKERFASGACTAVFNVGTEEDDEEEEREHPEDPTLGYFVAEPSAVVKVGERITLRYSVEKSSQCGIFAESGSNKTTVISKTPNKSLRVTQLPLPEWAMAGSSFNYILRCDSRPNAYYGGKIDALVESISISVVE